MNRRNWENVRQKSSKGIRYYPLFDHDAAFVSYEVFFLNENGNKLTLDSDKIEVSLFEVSQRFQISGAAVFMFLRTYKLLHYQRFRTHIGKFHFTSFYLTSHITFDKIKIPV